MSQDLKQYVVDKYMNTFDWFEEECNQPDQVNRISKVFNTKDYFRGIHKILQREDMMYKGEEYVTRKTVLQTIKSLVSFFNGYILSNPISLGGTNEEMTRQFINVYRLGRYNKLNVDILDRLIKWGSAYEFVYYDNGKIKSRILNSEDVYPIVSEKSGSYIGLIEHWTSDSNKVSYWNIYYPNKVESYCNEGGYTHLSDTKGSFGLPILYENKENIFDENISMLDDVKPILDELEDFINKLSDGVYTNAINPILVNTGAMLEMPKGVSAEANGFMVTLDNGGEMKYVTATMDSATIKLYIDYLQQSLYDIAEVPSILYGQGDVANISETSIKMMYAKSNAKASHYRYILQEGFEERNEIIRKILALKGITFNEDDYITIEFNFNIPMSDTDKINNLSKQFTDGALDKRTYIELSPLTSNTEQVMSRLNKDGVDNEQDVGV